jgi:uncharacterized membrane protein YgcG
MNGEILLLFVILLLALVLCSFLGGSNCSAKTEGFTSQNINGTYSGPNGANAIVTDTSIVFTNNGNVVTLTKNTSETTYTGPAGYTATFSSDGQLTISDSNGDTTMTTSTPSSTPSSSNYDNYNHYSGSSQPTTYYGPNGSTAKVIDVDGQGKIIITNANGTTNIYYIDTNTSASVKTYKGPNGGTATIATDNNGNTIILIKKPDGTSVTYSPTNIYGSSSQDPTMYSASNGSSSVTTVSGPNDNMAYAATGPNGNTTVGASNTYDSSAYYNSLPTGIPASQIPAGQEDLYILKSQVVPPVCPKCPDPIISSNSSSGSGSGSSGSGSSGSGSSGSGSYGSGTSFWSSGSSGSSDTSKCPPCPPCARCPEPAFDCKKVPNYNAVNSNYLPVPVLSDFSSFGM